MRIRYKPWVKDELTTCPFYVLNPEFIKNKWNDMFDKKQDIHLELGCGKGSFISRLSFMKKNINYIAIDITDVMLGMAKRNVEVIYGIRKSIAKEDIKDEILKQECIKNLKLVRYNIDSISNIFGTNDAIKRIYINFCNPWPKKRHKKRRLTSEKHLCQYKNFLQGKIFFKTDDDNLFLDSLEYFSNCKYVIEKVTYDLSLEKNFWDGEENIETEHEKMFKEQGIKIKALIASVK